MENIGNGCDDLEVVYPPAGREFTSRLGECIYSNALSLFTLGHMDIDSFMKIIDSTTNIKKEE